MPPTSSAFALPDRLAAKSDPALIAGDEEHFAAISSNLRRSIADLEKRLAAALRAPGGGDDHVVERDMEVRRLSARLRTLRRFGLDLCLGRIVPADGSATVYIGRLGLTDADGERLLIDWRSPAAEPFFGATHGDPMGLATRRRYRWSRGRISDYWDEVFTADGRLTNAALDDQSAFIASLGSSRSPRMRDVLATIQADQDAIIRASSRGALVVDGGPGTGKTVVALHRSAYLLYADPRLTRRHGGVLFVGPSPAYLAYVGDVLPSLGEEGVRICTVRDLVPEGAGELAADPVAAARIKASSVLLDAIDRAVVRFEVPPDTSMIVDTDWLDIEIEPADWERAFDAAEPGVPHNEAREAVWAELVEAVVENHREVPPTRLRRLLGESAELRGAFQRAWPMLDPAGVVADLLSVPGYLRACAPDLDDDAIRALRRDDPLGWTRADLPLLDAARHRIGDPGEARRRVRRAAALDAERERVDWLVEDVLAAVEDELGETSEMTMLRGADLQEALIDESALPSIDPDELAGPFAHIVIDEAQELTDAEWRMLVRRCPSRSFTIVGDRAQARRGFAESWGERLARVGIDRVEIASLTINYRTPEEIMAEAEPVIRSAIPDANVPTSIRSTGIPVGRAGIGERDAILADWLADHPEGVAVVIGAPDFEPPDRVRSLTAAEAKGLEFDLVLLAHPGALGDGVEGAVDRYVAMTRATERLIILE